MRQIPEDPLTTANPCSPIFSDKVFLVGSDCSGLCTDVYALKAVTPNAVRVAFTSETVASLKFAFRRQEARPRSQ